MNLDDKKPEAAAKEDRGILGRVFGRGGRESAEKDTHSPTRKAYALDLADIQGFILRGYRMPMVRHFLLTVTELAKCAGVVGLTPEQFRARFGYLAGLK